MKKNKSNQSYSLPMLDRNTWQPRHVSVTTMDRIELGNLTSMSLRSMEGIGRILAVREAKRVLEPVESDDNLEEGAKQDNSWARAALNFDGLDDEEYPPLLTQSGKVVPHLLGLRALLPEKCYTAPSSDLSFDNWQKWLLFHSAQEPRGEASIEWEEVDCLAKAFDVLQRPSLFEEIKTLADKECSRIPLPFRDIDFDLAEHYERAMDHATGREDPSVLEQLSNDGSIPWKWIELGSKSEYLIFTLIRGGYVVRGSASRGILQYQSMHDAITNGDFYYDHGTHELEPVPMRQVLSQWVANERVHTEDLRLILERLRRDGLTEDSEWDRSKRITFCADGFLTHQYRLWY